MKYLYNTTRFVLYWRPVTNIRVKIAYCISIQTYLFYLFPRTYKIKANFQYLTLAKYISIYRQILVFGTLKRVEPPGFEPGISACKAEVLANYTMTPMSVFKV